MKQLIAFLLMGIFAFTTFSCKKEDNNSCYKVSGFESSFTRAKDKSDELKFTQIRTQICEDQLEEDLGEGVKTWEVAHWYTTNNPIPGLPDLKRKESGTFYCKTIEPSDEYLLLTGIIDWTSKETYVGGTLTPVGSPEGKKNASLKFYKETDELEWDGVLFKPN